MSPQFAAKTFAGLIGLVIAFQLALALGAPWGAIAMGGAFRGAFPPAMRLVALLQVAVLAGVAVVVLSGAGLVLARWRVLSRKLVWVVVGLLAVVLVLNLITPSPMERLIWAPFALVLFAASLRVALAGAGSE
jgi:hypothetical protein